MGFLKGRQVTGTLFVTLGLMEDYFQTPHTLYRSTKNLSLLQQPKVALGVSNLFPSKKEAKSSPLSKPEGS
jgi:hypothetical protein